MEEKFPVEEESTKGRGRTGGFKKFLGNTSMADVMAILISLVAVGTANVAMRQAHDVNQEMLKLERTATVKPRISIGAHSYTDDWRILSVELHNSGRGQARDFIIMLDAVSDSGSSIGEPNFVYSLVENQDASLAHLRTDSVAQIQMGVLKALAQDSLKFMIANEQCPGGKRQLDPKADFAFNLYVVYRDMEGVRNVTSRILSFGCSGTLTLADTNLVHVLRDSCRPPGDFDRHIELPLVRSTK